MRSRFAPSPTGRMHLGNVFCALLSWLTARSQGGEWLLRIEDIDPQRSKREYALQLMDDLMWLGLEWDGEVVWQSQRGDIYEHYLEKLKEQNLTYPCYCTRADIMATQAPHETDGRIVYAGTCREILQVKRHGIDNRKGATRVIVPDEIIKFTDGLYGEQGVNLAKHCGDFVVRRADGAWAYQLAVVVDDALMGITDIVRGNDLLLSTPQQIYLYRCLGFDVPHFIHHPLLCNEAGQRLCKRDKSLDMGVMREQHSAEEIIGKLAHFMGLNKKNEPLSAKELVDIFSWNNLRSENILCPTDRDSCDV